MSSYSYFKAVLELHRARLQGDERGELEEKVIIVGLCAAAALLVIGLLIAKIQAREASTTI